VTRQPTGQGMWDKADYVELTEARAYISMYDSNFENSHDLI
jgi:hypothetical protein